jgi:hypothetical protein
LSCAHGPSTRPPPALAPRTFPPHHGSKFFIGGNFKANGTVADAQKLIATLNSATIAGA